MILPFLVLLGKWEIEARYKTVMRKSVELATVWVNQRMAVFTLKGLRSW